MGGRSCPSDNALRESFFASLETELLETWYNARRRHSALAYLAPMEYERQWQLTATTT
jgi:transposase InsO family protein